MVNNCQFIGRLGKDPENRFLPDGKAVVSFSLACSESWKDKSGAKQERTEWINCTAWGRLAEIIGEYCSKGMLLYVCGRCETRKWQDKDGNDRYTTGFNIHEMKMLSPRGSNGDSSQGQQAGDSYQAPEMGGDVPF